MKQWVWLHNNRKVQVQLARQYTSIILLRKTFPQISLHRIPVCPNRLKTMIIPYWGCTVCVLKSQWLGKSRHISILLKCLDLPTIMILIHKLCIKGTTAKQIQACQQTACRRHTNCSASVGSNHCFQAIVPIQE